MGMGSVAQGLEHLYRPSALAVPDRLVFPPPWVGHIPFAFWIVDVLKPGNLVELGAHSGNSYCAFLQAVVASESSTACYAVDTWEGDKQAGYYGDDVYNDLQDYAQTAYGSFSSSCA